MKFIIEFRYLGKKEATNLVFGDEGFHHKNLAGYLMSNSGFHSFKVDKITARNVWWLIVEIFLSSCSGFVVFIWSNGVVVKVLDS